MSFNQSLLSHYSDFFQYKKARYEKYINSIVVKTSDNLIINMPTFEQKMKNDLLFVIFKTDEQSRLYAEQGKTGIFITLTLDSVFHKNFSSINIDNLNLLSECYFNGKLDRSLVVEEGYKVLNKAFRYLYNKFSYKNKYIRLNYSKVIEPHKKDFTPHLHGILFVDSHLVDSYIKFFNKSLKKLRSIGIGVQNDIQVLKDTKKTSGYITKYVRKSLENIAVKGWALKHKFRLFTTSRDIIPRYVFKIVSGRVNVDQDLVKNTSYINAHLQSCRIVVNNYLNNSYISSKSFGNLSSDFVVYISRFKLSFYSELDDKIIDKFSCDYHFFNGGVLKFKKQVYYVEKNLN